MEELVPRKIEKDQLQYTLVMKVTSLRGRGSEHVSLINGVKYHRPVHVSEPGVYIL